MTSGLFSGVVTAVLLVAFVAGVLWAWSSKRKKDFDQASRLPLDEDREKNP
jgi:cytochrome c oxidase cbb3-type subunit 4